MEVLALWLHWRKGHCKRCALTAKKLSVTCCMGKRKHFESYSLKGFFTARRWVEEADYNPSSFSVLTRSKLTQGWRLWVVVHRVYCDESSFL